MKSVVLADGWPSLSVKSLMTCEKYMQNNRTDFKDELFAQTDFHTQSIVYIRKTYVQCTFSFSRQMNTSRINFDYRAIYKR